MKQKHEDKMIRKARFKFVLGATAATFAAMLVLVISINLVRYVQVRRQQEETLQSLSRHEMAGPVGDAGHGVFFPDDAPPFPEYDGGGYYFTEDGEIEYDDDDSDESEPWEKDGRGEGRRGGRGNAYTQFGGRYYEISVLQDGTASLSTKNTDAMTSEQAGTLAAAVIEEGKETGYRDDYRYLVRSGADGTTVVSLLDCTMDAKSLSDLRMITAAVGLLGTLAAFLFILFTSKKAVMPLAESMEKQKRFITDAGH